MGPACIFSNINLHKVVGYYTCRVPTVRGTHNQRLRKTKPLPINDTSQNSKRDASTAFRLVRGILKGTPRPRSDSYEAYSTRRLDRVPTRTRYARRDASTTFRLVRGILNGIPRPRSDSYEARSTRHLDYREISDSHDPGSGHSTHLIHQL
jgi:hypothetical protein